MLPIGLISFFSLIIAVLFCFVSCSSNAGAEFVSSESHLTVDGTESGKTDGAPSSEDIHNHFAYAYTFHPLPQPEDGWAYNSLHIDTYNGMLCIDMFKQEHRNFISERCIAVLDPDIGIVKNIPYSKPQADHYDDEMLLEGIRGMRMIDENTFLHSSYTNVLRYTQEREGELASGYLMLCDAAGTVLAESIIPGIGRNRSVMVLPDGRIAVLGEDSVCIYDRALHLLGQVMGSQKTTLLISPKGEVIAQGLYHGTYQRIDTEQYDSTAEMHYDPPDNITGIAGMFFSVEESAYEVYFTNEIGFWGCDAGDDAADLLCDWRSSDLLYSNLTVLGVLDENRILISFREPLTDTNALGWLCRNS